MKKLSVGSPYSLSLFRHGGILADSTGLDFSVSINPLGPPTAVVEFLRESAAHVSKYPDPGNQEFVRALADRHGIPEEGILVGNGANELIHLVMQALRPRRVVIVEPTYTEYLRASLLIGAKVDHWLADGDDFSPAPFDPGSAEAVWLCNPNNPTGRLWKADELRRWVREFPRTTFVVDEAFMPFVDDELRHSQIAITPTCENLMVIRSMTKFYAIPGLRLGYAAAHPRLMERVRRFGIPWSVNRLAQCVGPLALNDLQYAERSRRYCREEIKRLVDGLRRSGRLKVMPTDANFVLVRFGNEEAARDAVARLEIAEFHVRKADNFIGLDGRYFRVGMRNQEENCRLVEVLRGISHCD